MILVAKMGVYLLSFLLLHFPEMVSFLIAPLWRKNFGDQQVPVQGSSTGPVDP